MAGITFFGGVEMVCVFAGGDGAIMATGANANDFIVIYIGRRDRLPGGWSDGMTGIAIIRRSDMRCPFTAGDGSIVTTDAGTDDLRVIYCNWLNGCPGGRERGMTTVALVS